MRFVYTITVPAGTTHAEPVSETAKLQRGRLTAIEVLFPPGPAGRVHLVVRDAALQIAPANPEETFHWDDHSFHFPMDYLLSELGHELTITGWAPSAGYPHDIQVHFDVVPEGADDERELIELIAMALAVPEQG